MNSNDQSYCEQNTFYFFNKIKQKFLKTYNIYKYIRTNFFQISKLNLKKHKKNKQIVLNMSLYCDDEFDYLHECALKI